MGQKFVLVDATSGAGASVSGGALAVTGSFSASVGTFAPNGNYASLAVSTTSQNVALPAGVDIIIYNAGPSAVYLHLGTSSSVVATTSNDQLQPNSWISFAVGSNTYLAAITSTSTATINVSGGSGLATGAGGGSSGGGGSSAPSATVGSASPTVRSPMSYKDITSGDEDFALGSTNGLSVSQGPLNVSSATALNTTFSATGVSSTFTPDAGRNFNLAGYGSASSGPGLVTLNGTVFVERSIDGGITFLPVTASGTQLLIWTTNFSEQWSESQVSAQYRFRCSAYVSGTITVMMTN